MSERIYYRVPAADPDERWGPMDMVFDGPDDMAEGAASDFHANHDGWEYDWPLTFMLEDESGKALGIFDVEASWEVNFIAHEVKENGWAVNFIAHEVKEEKDDE